MGSDMWNIQPTTAEINKVSGEGNKNKLSDAAIKDWFSKYEESSKLCMLVYGADGSAKSGLVCSFMNRLEVGQKMVLIDLDGGDLPLIKTYYANRTEDIIHLNPLVLTGAEIDYVGTFEKIRTTIDWVKRNYEKENIKALVFDGLSTALTYAEQQMRIEKNINPDGGVNMAYWKIRNKLFIETLEQIKSLPIARFFIAHEDFVLKTDKETNSAVKEKTNQMMFQKILCQRKEDFGKVKFVATVHKSKYDINLENDILTLAEVDKEKKKSTFDTKPFWDKFLS